MNKVSKAFLLFILIFVGGQVLACDEDTPSFLEIQNSGRHKISGPFSIGHLEKDQMIEIRQIGEILPFGYANESWKKFKSKMKEGDHIYFFEYTEPGFYMDGHFLVHDGCVIDVLRGSVS